MKITSTLKRFGLRNYSLLDKCASRLGGKNLQFKNRDGTIVFLKTGQGAAAKSLFRERIALEWLEDKRINVPKVLNYFDDKSDGAIYLLLSALKGSAAQKIADLDKKEILRTVATALKQFHSISVDGSGNLWTLDNDLDHIRDYLKFNLIKRRNFQKANKGKTPEDVYSYLLQMRGKLSNRVIVHGDYCLPNILIAKNSYGFLDVGNCGPGDPYKDFSAMEVSIARNFGREWIKFFYKYYGGTKEIDMFKVQYYQLIDQFGYHLDIDKYLELFND